jgi:hypothetical protein
MEYSFIYDIPLLLVGGMGLALLIFSLEVGFRIGFSQRNKWKDADTGGGAVVLSSMFALFGLILAFTYAAGVQRHDARKAALNAEANAIGTAFLRADLIDSENATILKTRLLEYAKTRIVKTDILYTTEQREMVLENMLQAQAKLWPALKKLLSDDMSNAKQAALINALNDVLDSHLLRLAAVKDKLPSFAVWVVVFIAIATLSVTGFHSGLTGKISRWRTYMLAAAISCVLLMILDFDQPLTGFIQLSNDSMIMTVTDMENNLRASAKMP